MLSEERKTGKELKKRERHRKTENGAVQWKKKTEGKRQRDDLECGVILRPETLTEPSDMEQNEWDVKLYLTYY